MSAIERAFGEQLNTRRKSQIAKATFHQFWRATFRMVPSDAELANVKTLALRGEHHLRAALSRGKGVILLESNGFGTRVMARQILHAHGYAICQVHGRRHIGSGFIVHGEWTWGTRRLMSFFEAHEKEFVLEIIYLEDSDALGFTRLLLERLRQNSIVCISVEGRVSHRLIDLPFLGRQQKFSTGMINLARVSGATVLPLFCVDDGGIAAIVEAPIDVASEMGREASLIAGVRESVRLLERYCKTYPEQYYAWSGLFRDRHSKVIGEAID